MTSFFPVRLVQPDRRTCGPAVLVAARMLESPAFAESVMRGGAEAAQARFAAETLATHRATNRAVDRAGRVQLPWPRALGTAPWALARHVEGRVRHVGLPRRRAGAYDALVASLRTGPTPVYLGDRWSPRHVVLAVAAEGDSAGRAEEQGVTCYEPASGRRTRFTRDQWQHARLEGCGGWPVPWAVISRRARRTPA